MRLLPTAVATSLLALVACGGQPPAQQDPPPLPVDVATVITMPVEDTVELTARLESPSVVEVRPQISGMLERVLFTEGSEVTAGQILAEIDPRSFRARQEQAEARVRSAEATVELTAGNLARGEEIRAKDPGMLSTEDLARRRAEAAAARAALAAAQAAFIEAQLDLERSRLTAPAAGRIGRALVKPGNLVQGGTMVPNGGTQIATIVQQDPLEVVFALSEADARRVVAFSHSASVAVAVAVGLAGETGYPHQTVLTFLDNRVDTQTGTVQARARLDNAARSAVPGGFARVRVPLGPARELAVIDETAVFAMQAARLVLMLMPDNSVVPRPVVLGARLPGGLRAVETGLAPGERIALQPAFPRILPGKVIAPRPVEMDPAKRQHSAAMPNPAMPSASATAATGPEVAR